jgi:hypothetical protein
VLVFGSLVWCLGRVCVDAWPGTKSEKNIQIP